MYVRLFRDETKKDGRGIRSDQPTAAQARRSRVSLMKELSYLKYIPSRAEHVQVHDNKLVRAELRTRRAQCCARDKFSLSLNSRRPRRALFGVMRAVSEAQIFSFVNLYAISKKM
jgi:hypothetical protein